MPTLGQRIKINPTKPTWAGRGKGWLPGGSPEEFGVLVTERGGTLGRCTHRCGLQCPSPTACLCFSSPSPESALCPLPQGPPSLTSSRRSPLITLPRPIPPNPTCAFFLPRTPRTPALSACLCSVSPSPQAVTVFHCYPRGVVFFSTFIGRFFSMLMRLFP